MHNTNRFDKCFSLNIIILDYRQREVKRRNSPIVSPPPRSRRKKNKKKFLLNTNKILFLF
jgi:hypothetical protein